MTDLGFAAFDADNHYYEALDAVTREAGRKGIRSIQHVYITSGGSEAIELAMSALVNAGENVLTPSPGYPLYTAVTAKLMAEGVKSIRGFFVREYLLERFEHMVDNATFTSVYPRVSLAPNQRFASKGCYIVALGAGDPRPLEPASRWIVP